MTLKEGIVKLYSVIDGILDYRAKELSRMMTLTEFTPHNQYLVCVDSDGCAIDTMDIKHIRCFGPCMVEEWKLNEWKTPILSRWNDINLYTMTRGINRFKGLVMALSEIDQAYTSIEGIQLLKDWSENSPELSEGSLKKIIEETENEIFKKALNWSQSVNRNITLLQSEDKKAFIGVKESLASIQGKADIVIVSSANLEAVLEEWKENDLLDYVDLICTQHDGSKKYIIEQLIKKGYEKEHILMCGDAPGDLDAAKDNQVLFYPILVRKEVESWENFQEAFNKMEAHTYLGEFQIEKEMTFKTNLGMK